MVEKMVEKGLPGLSRCFRAAVKDFNREGNVLFVGSPFTCLPFAEFLSYSIRDLPLKAYFMPGTDMSLIRQIVVNEGFGFQLGALAVSLPKFDIVVLLGGLALPKSQVSPSALKKVLLKVSDLSFVMALFFQGIMKKPEWLEEFKFVYLIDADIGRIVLEEMK